MNIKHMKKTAAAAVLLLAGIALPWALKAQFSSEGAAETPFAMEEFENPNVMFIIDNTAYMEQSNQTSIGGPPGGGPPGGGDIDNRSRIQVLRDVMAGTLNQVTYNGDPVFIPHPYTVDEYVLPPDYWLGDEVAEVMPLIYRLTKNDLLKYDPSLEGTYFVFYGPDDAALSDPLIDGATTTFDEFMRLQESEHIRLAEAGGAVVLSDGSEVTRNIWTTASPVSSELTYGDALRAYWDYEELGVIYSSTTAEDLSSFGQVVPVRLVPADENATEPDPSGKTDSGTINGLCYYRQINLFQGGYLPCVKPDASSQYFVFYDDLEYGDRAQEVQNNKQSFAQWYQDNGNPEAYCLYDGGTEVWGDEEYVNWQFDSQDRARNDGWKHDEKVYKACLANDPGAVPVGGETISDSRIKNEILGALPCAEKVQNPLDTLPGTTVAEDDEFIMHWDCSAGTTLDTYLKDNLAEDRTAGEVDWTYTLSLDDPWFGDYFGVPPDKLIYYDGAWTGEPGIMDQFPDVNYGIMRFDVTVTRACDETPLNPAGYWDDFPPDSDAAGSCDERGLGSDLVWNVSSWADYPYYRAQGLSSRIVNRKLQWYIRSHWGVDSENYANAPISSVVHDAYRYFFNEDMDYAGHPGDVAHTQDTDDHDSMFFNLAGYGNGCGGDDWQNPTRQCHVIQDDAFYMNCCRRNYFILLTGAKDTFGEIYIDDCIDAGFEGADLRICAQSYWIDHLKGLAGDYTAVNNYIGDMTAAGPGNCPQEVRAVKGFFITFGGLLAWDEKMATHMALASDMDEGPYDLSDLYWGTEDGTTQKTADNQDVYDFYFDANNEVELRDYLTTIMNEIMSGQIARAAPAVSLQHTSEEVNLIYVTSYFEITDLENLWRGHLFAWQAPLYGGTPEPYWDPEDAGARLSDSSMTDPASRKIFTSIDLDGGLIDGNTDKLDITATAIENNLSVFDPEGGGGLDSSTQREQLVNFILGDGATYDAGGPHSWLLGAIFRSNPQIVTRPGSGLYRGLPGYSSFANTYEDRRDVVYVGTMFGNLEAFALHSGETLGIPGFEGGDELFAYIPQGVLKNLYLLRKGIQIYGVDATPTISDAFGNFDGDTQWRTLLVSGAGGGSTAYFAADVTEVGDTTVTTTSDPAAGFDPLWRFSHPNLAYTWSTPVLLPVLGNNKIGREFKVFFGGGLRRDAFEIDAETPGSFGGFFYVIDAEDGALDRVFELYGANQIAPTDLTTFDASTTTPDLVSGATNYNQVPAKPVIVDKNSDGIADWVYIGDLDGRIWKIDVSDGDSPPDWDYCLFFDSADGDPIDGTIDNPDWRKPIWYEIEPARTSDGDFIIYAVTGHVEIKEYADDLQEVNRMFAVADTDAFGQCTYGEDITVVSGLTADYWPVEFSPGEKPITPPILFDGKVYTKTYHPESTMACAAGKFTIYKIDYLTGQVLDTIDTTSPSHLVEGPQGPTQTDLTPDEPPRPKPDPLETRGVYLPEPMLWGEETW